MVNIYILRLTQGKFYIGKTSNPTFRISSHFNLKGGAVWTNKYKPLNVVKIIKNCDDFDEDKYTKMYMKRYGIDNVRGGSYVTENLMDSQKKLIHKEILCASNRCYGCGKTGHFINNCNQKKKESNQTLQNNNLGNNQNTENYFINEQE